MVAIGRLETWVETDCRVYFSLASSIAMSSILAGSVTRNPSEIATSRSDCSLTP
jgi:hypothetical protein